MENVPSFRSAREQKMEARASTKKLYKYILRITYITYTDRHMNPDRRIKQDITQNVGQEHNGKGALALVLQCFWFEQYFSKSQVQEAEWN